MSHILPALVTKLTYIHEAWIVGSAATPNTDLTAVRDFDVLVPFNQWREAALLIPPDAVPNTFGGWKCRSEGREVDVWPGDLAWLLSNKAAKWVWHPKTDSRFIRI